MGILKRSTRQSLEKGQSLVEYSLIAALLVISFGLAVAATGPALSNVFCRVALNLVQDDAPDEGEINAAFDPTNKECREVDTGGNFIGDALPDAEEFWLTVTMVASRTPNSFVIPTRTLPPPSPTFEPGEEPEIPTLEPTVTPFPSSTPPPSPTALDRGWVAPWEDSANEPVRWRLDDSFYTGSEDWYGIYYNNRSLTAPYTTRLYNGQINEAFKNNLNFNWQDGSPHILISDPNNWSASFRKPIWINEAVADKATISIDIPRVDDGIRVWILGEQFGGSKDVQGSGPGACSGTGVTSGGLGTSGSDWAIYDDAYFGYNPDTDPAEAAPTECLIVDHWKHGGGTGSQYSIKRTLPAGLYMIQVDYYDEIGDASLSVSIGSTDQKINPDDTAVNPAGAPIDSATTCGWYNRESDKLPNSLDYMWDEFRDGSNLPAGNRCFLELRGWVEIPAAMTDAKLTFWDVWEMNTGVSGWVEIGDYDAYQASGDRSDLNWQSVDLHEGLTYNYNWSHHTVDLAAYAGKRVALRFGIENRSSAAINRWYIDTIRIGPSPRENFYMSERWHLNDTAQANDFITSGHWELVNENALGVGMAWHESPGRSSAPFTEYRNASFNLPIDYNDTRIHSIEFNGVIDVNHPDGVADLEGDVGDPMLTFWHEYNLGSLTRLEVQYTTDGVTSDPNASYGDTPPVWQTVPGDDGVLFEGSQYGGNTNNQMTFVEIPLQPIVDLGHTRFRLRFAMIMRHDASNGDGWWIDEIQLERNGTEKYLPYPFYDDVDDVATVRYWEGDWGRIEEGRNANQGIGYSYTDSPNNSYANNRTYNLTTAEAFDIFMDSPENIRSAACELGAACETPDTAPIQPMLEFYWWRDVNTNDHLYVEWKRRSEEDTEWQMLWAYESEMATVGKSNDRETRTQYDWERAEVNLKPMMDILTAEDDINDPLDDDIVLRFRFTSNNSGSGDGYYIDDIRVRERNSTIWRLWPAGAAPTDSNGNALPVGNGTTYYDGVDVTGTNTDGTYWHIGGSWSTINWESRGGISSFHDSPATQSKAPPFTDGSRITDFSTQHDTYQVLEMAPWIDLRGVDASDEPMLAFWSRYAVGRDDVASVEISYFEPDKYDDPSLINYCRNGYKQCYEKNYGWSEWRSVWRQASDKRTYTWQYERINLSDFAKGGTTGEGRIIRIRFVLDALRNSNTWDGWYIDEVRVQHNEPRVYVIDRDLTEGAIFDQARNMRNWIGEGDWGISQQFGRGQSPTSGLGQLIWNYEYVNLRHSSIASKCGTSNHINCASNYFGNYPLPTSSSPGSHIGQVTSINYPDAEFHLDYDDLEQSYLGARWITTTNLVGPFAIGGVIEPGTYFFQTISDDGVRLRYEVASGTCTLPTTPTTELPLAGQYWNMINNWNGHGDTVDTGRAVLQSGCTYRFELQWFQGTGGLTIILSQGTSGNMSFTDSPEFGADENQDVMSVPRSNSSLLLNGVLDLTGAENPVVQYYTYHDLYGTARVEVSPDGGFTWTQEGLAGASAGASPVWTDQWRADFFANRELSGTPAYTNVPAGNEIDFVFNNLGEPFAAVPDNWRQDDASIRFTRTFTIAEETSFVFKTDADDGVRLWVDYDPGDPNCVALASSGGGQTGSSTVYPSPQFTGDCLIIDNWRNQGGNPLTVMRTFEAGTHELQLDYFEATGGAFVSMDILQTNNGVAFDEPNYNGNQMPSTPGDVPFNWRTKAHDLSAYAGPGMPYISLRFRLDRQGNCGPDENCNGGNIWGNNQNPFNFKVSWWVTDITIAEP